MLQALTRLVLGAVAMVGAAQATPAAAQDKTILISFSKASYPFFEAVRAHAEDERGSSASVSSSRTGRATRHPGRSSREHRLVGLMAS